MRGMSNERFRVSPSFKIKQRNKRSNSKFKQKSNQAQNRDKFIQLEFEFILKYEGGLLLRHVLNPNNRWNNPAIKIVRLLVEPKHKQIQGQDVEKLSQKKNEVQAEK